MSYIDFVRVRFVIMGLGCRKPFPPGEDGATWAGIADGLCGLPEDSDIVSF